jgi:TolB protein
MFKILCSTRRSVADLIFRSLWLFIHLMLFSQVLFAQNLKSDTTSYILTVDVHTFKIDTILVVNGHIEAPNWHRDNYLILNSRGKLYTLDLLKPELKPINTGLVRTSNNDHGVSPDGKWLAISYHDANNPSSKAYKSTIGIVPINGGEPRNITRDVPSYWHGWSPDGKQLIYCAERNGNYDVYRISVNGGVEQRLTNDPGLDDGPEYGPDGKFIYFNSYRTGHMQIWRMLSDGSAPEQLTFDQNSNWFAHPSPDNQFLVFIAYQSDENQDHLFGKDVRLRLLRLSDKSILDLTPVFYGGQGTINVPSWSPDGSRVAFVAYRVNKIK